MALLACESAYLQRWRWQRRYRAHDWLRIAHQDLGFECKVHRTYVGGIERGERNPTVLTLIKMTAVLKTTPAKLLRDAEAGAQ